MLIILISSFLVSILGIYTVLQGYQQIVKDNENPFFHKKYIRYEYLREKIEIVKLRYEYYDEESRKINLVERLKENISREMGEQLKLNNFIKYTIEDNHFRYSKYHPQSKIIIGELRVLHPKEEDHNKYKY